MSYEDQDKSGWDEWKETKTAGWDAWEEFEASISQKRYYKTLWMPLDITLRPIKGNYYMHICQRNDNNFYVMHGPANIPEITKENIITICETLAAAKIAYRMYALARGIHST
jgi:hypothetical protein